MLSFAETNKNTIEKEKQPERKQRVMVPDTKLISPVKQTLCSFALIIDLIHMEKLTTGKKGIT